VPLRELQHEDKFYGEVHHEVPVYEEKSYHQKSEQSEEHKKEEPIYLEVGKTTKITLKEPVRFN
jgi:hypothetical protein